MTCLWAVKLEELVFEPLSSFLHYYHRKLIHSSQSALIGESSNFSLFSYFAVAPKLTENVPPHPPPHPSLLALPFSLPLLLSHTQYDRDCCRAPAPEGLLQFNLYLGGKTMRFDLFFPFFLFFKQFDMSKACKHSRSALWRLRLEWITAPLPGIAWRHQPASRDARRLAAGKGYHRLKDEARVCFCLSLIPGGASAYSQALATQWTATSFSFLLSPNSPLSFINIPSMIQQVIPMDLIPSYLIYILAFPSYQM